MCPSRVEFSVVNNTLRVPREVKVGDLVVVHENEELPSDLLVLSTSLSQGTCYGGCIVITALW